MTTNQQGVTYTLSAFKRAGFVGGDQHLLLMADQDPHTALDALQAATNAVTKELLEYEHRDEAYISLDGPVPTPAGPIARVRDCEPAKALPLMLDHLAADLASRGITGRLVPAKTFKDDSPFGNNALPALGMLLSPLNDTDAMYAAFDDWRKHPGNRGSWVDEARHRRVITALVDWVTHVQGTVLIHTTATIEATPDALVPYLTRALRDEPLLGISATSPDRRTRRQVRFAESEVIVCDYDPDQPRAEQLDSLTDLATRLAPDLAYALIRELGAQMIAISMTAQIFPKTPFFDDVTHPHTFKHLEPDYVFDAGVAQVLTTSQLAKTTLPTDRWNIRDLAHDRYLVTAVDPAPWLHPDPHYVSDFNSPWPDWTDPHVLAAARADFANAIMTLETLRQNPPPLTADQLRTTPELRNIGVAPPT